MAQLPEEKKLEQNNFEFNLFNSTYFQVNNKNIVKKINEDTTWRSAFGNLIIDINDNDKTIKTVIWKIKINNTTNKTIMIGICKDEWNVDGNGSNATQHGYMYNSSNGTKYNGSAASYSKAINGKDSIVIMNLNVIAKTLSFNIDNEDAGIAFQNLPNGKYHLAIDISEINGEIEVTSENIEYNHALINITNSLNDIQTTLKALNVDIIKQEQILSTLNIEKLLKEGQYVGEAEEKNKLLNKEVENLNKNLENYKKKLNDTLNPDMTDYKNWDTEDVVKWIMTLDDGIYNKYSNKLLELLKQSEVKGIDLINLSRPELRDFGVSAFTHRVSLFQHIEELTKKDRPKDRSKEGERETVGVH